MEEFRVEKLSPEARDKVDKVLAEVKAAGYKFEVEETSDQIIFGFENGIRTHLMKIDPFPHDKHVHPGIPIQEAVRETILKHFEKSEEGR